MNSQRKPQKRSRLHTSEQRRRLLELLAMISLTALLIILSRLESRLFELSKGLAKNSEFISTIVYFGLINVNVVLILVLSFLVFRNIAKLVIERRHGVIGSKLRTKIIATLVFFALAPTAVMFYISSQFITTSFDSWFSTKVRETMRQTSDISRQVYKQDQRRLESIARIALQKIKIETKKEMPPQINASHLRTFESDYGIKNIAVSDSGGVQIWPQRLAGTPIESVALIDAIDKFRASRELLSLGALEVSNDRDTVKGFAPIFSVGLQPELIGVVITEERFDSQILRSVDTILAEFAALRPGAQLIRLSYLVLLVMMAALIAFSTTWLGFYVSRAIVSPLQSLSEAMGEVAAGNYHVTLPKPSDDETGALVHAFNRMIHDLRDHEDRNARFQKVAAWREVARRIAHEIKNPITPIRLSAERLNRRFSKNFSGDDHEVFTGCVATIIAQVDSLKDLVNEFTKFSRMPPVQSVQADLVAVLKEVVDLFKHSYGEIEFDTSQVELSTLIWGFDKDQINRVLVNIVANAVAAVREAVLESGGDAKIIFALQLTHGNSTAQIEIVDTGTGIAKSAKDRVFEPYFSTKEDGTGLGLAIVNQIIADHGGNIRLLNNQPRGTRVIIELPKGELPNMKGGHAS